MDLELCRKNVGFSLESHVINAYNNFIDSVEDYENQWERSRAGLWDLFDPVYTALASSRPASVGKEEWAKDLILAYRNVGFIKKRLLENTDKDKLLENTDKDKNEEDGEVPNPLDVL